MWKHVAMRQYERRRKAQEYNATLREMLEMQVQEAKCLQRILKRRSRIQDVNNLPPPADNSQIFTKMLHELEENYLHVDSHFADKGVNALPCPGWKQERNSSAITGVVLEISQRNLLPFSLHTVKKSVWTILKGLETGDLKRIHDFNNMFKFHGQYSEESRDTITTSYFSASPGIEAVRGAQIRKVSRVYVEENRIVLIWKMLAEPKLEGSNAPAGYHIEMTLQMVMQQDEALTVSGCQSTHLMIHFSGLRRDLEIPVSSMFRGRGHNEICIALWENLISSIPVEIESVLIDSTCDAVDEVAQLQEYPIVGA
ncbi:Hypothetical protein PHPALM_15101 [Phytophthora palmivora]|uniref:M96 mating-specific protein family n=1 Tax=Phytophthora palmivora TaxID=4796 RepID=A0A2P4XT69_9STRA|nr:Hypothetical protein PHPALM_15101 [Phytophthora palmivora]